MTPAAWAIASPNRYSSAVGEQVFRAGGNAIDAALAAAASLVVTTPDNCGPGGDLIALVRQPSGATVAINASGTAAAATSPDELRARHGNTMPLFGAETVTVPGVLAGWEALAAHGASLGWHDLLGPAITQAEDGVPAPPSVAVALERDRRRLGADPGMRECFFDAGRPLREGQLMRQRQLAETLRIIAGEGTRAFYDGRVGRAWLRSMRGHGSLLSPDDLAGYTAEVTAPVEAPVGAAGDRVLTAPPNSQGLFLLMTLSLVTRFEGELDPLTGDAARLAEIFRTVAEARADYLADPRFADLPITEIVSGTLTAGPRPGATARRGRGDTVALVTVDGDGRAVCLIQSLFDYFGAGILDPATGIVAHNRGCFFSLDANSPNVIAPGKRPAHTLTPVMVAHGDDLQAVLGTMGGLAQTQILTQVILHLRRGFDASEAVSAPRWTVGGIEAGSQQASIQVEARVPRPAKQALGQAGWALVPLAELDSQVGEAQAILCSNGRPIAAASDPRSPGAAYCRS